MRLTVTIASRGRPALLNQAIDAALSNAALPSTRVLAAVDQDDDATLAEVKERSRLKISVRKREDSVGAKWNRALRELPADVTMMATDNSVIASPGYDREIIDAARLFPDGIGCVYTKMANASFPHYQAVTSRWADIVGRIYPTYFPYWFVDHWLDDVARMTGRIIMTDVVVDDTSRQGLRTTEMRDVRLWCALFDSLQEERREEARRLIAKMDDQPWRKALQLRSFPQVEARSLWINQMCRASAEAIEYYRGAGAPDERYARIKEVGSDRLRERIADLEREAARTEI